MDLDLFLLLHIRTFEGIIRIICVVRFQGFQRGFYREIINFSHSFDMNLIYSISIISNSIEFY